MTPEISVLVPVYNEAEVLPVLFERLYRALDGYGHSYEVIFINDGSTDASARLLDTGLRYLGQALWSCAIVGLISLMFIVGGCLVYTQVAAPGGGSR